MGELPYIWKKAVVFPILCVPGCERSMPWSWGKVPSFWKTSCCSKEAPLEQAIGLQTSGPDITDHKDPAASTPQTPGPTGPGSSCLPTRKRWEWKMLSCTHYTNPSAAEHLQDQGDGGGLQKEEIPSPACLHRRLGCGVDEGPINNEDCSWMTNTNIIY